MDPSIAESLAANDEEIEALDEAANVEADPERKQELEDKRNKLAAIQLLNYRNMFTAFGNFLGEVKTSTPVKQLTEILREGGKGIKKDATTIVANSLRITVVCGVFQVTQSLELAAAVMTVLGLPKVDSVVKAYKKMKESSVKDNDDKESASLNDDDRTLV